MDIMKTSNRRIPAVILVIAGWLSTPANVFACGCAPVEGVSFDKQIADELNQAVHVFAGRVVPKDDLTATIAVDTFWKGDGAPQVSLGQAKISRERDHSDQFLRLLVHDGARYLVFAYQSGRELRASQCGGTGMWESAMRVVAALDSLAPRQKPQ